MERQRLLWSHGSHMLSHTNIMFQSIRSAGLELENPVRIELMFHPKPRDSFEHIRYRGKPNIILNLVS